MSLAPPPSPRAGAAAEGGEARAARDAAVLLAVPRAPRAHPRRPRPAQEFGKTKIYFPVQAGLAVLSKEVRTGAGCTGGALERALAPTSLPANTTTPPLRAGPREEEGGDQAAAAGGAAGGAGRQGAGAGCGAAWAAAACSPAVLPPLCCRPGRVRARRASQPAPPAAELNELKSSLTDEQIASTTEELTAQVRGARVQASALQAAPRAAHLTPPTARPALPPAQLADMERRLAVLKSGAVVITKEEKAELERVCCWG